ncbi:hypothetical protein SUGI_0973750 [Cryptomeria japonica]|nr:hypothetical protein SUGI_0973750 [Cryptomeria japonica]
MVRKPRYPFDKRYYNITQKLSRDRRPAAEPASGSCCSASFELQYLLPLISTSCYFGGSVSAFHPRGISFRGSDFL